MTRAKKLFDLTILMKHGDLNVRHVVVEEPDLTVGEFFQLLSDFLNQAPAVLDALYVFAEREGDKIASRRLDSTTALLKRLECEKCVPEFYALLDAYGKGDWRLAATHARAVLADFKGLFSRTETAVKPMSALSKEGLLPDEKMILGAYIKLLAETKANRKPVILAVDDSPVILKSVASVLEDEYKVYTLIKPAMLPKILEQVTPDLFLLDYKMPEINGFELIPMIREHEEHKNTPIIFLTSEGTIDNVTAALALGASDFTVKPFKPEVLREKVGKHIGRGE